MWVDWTMFVGAKVILACRDLEKCAKAQKEIVDESHNNKVVCKKLDLASFKSIREFSAEIQKGNSFLLLNSEWPCLVIIDLMIHPTVPLLLKSINSYLE